MLKFAFPHYVCMVDGSRTTGKRELTLNRRSVLAAMGGLTIGAAGVGSASATQDGDTVTLVHDTHFHGRFEDASDAELNIERYYAVAQALREQHENAAFVGNGDDLAPSLLGLEYEGEHMVEALNYMQPDVVGAGNHEFDFGVDVAEQRFTDSEFPWVVANLLTPDGEPVPGTERWTVVETGSASIGVFGMGTEGFHDITSYPEDWQVLGNVEAAREAVTALREEEGVDFVVCASHVSTGAQERIAEEVDGLDAIVGSHSGVTFEEPADIEGTTVAEFGDEFANLGRLTFDLESGDIVDWERIDFYNSAALEDGESPPGGDHDNHVPRDVQEISGDQELASLADEYIEKLEDRLSEPVVQSEVALNATFDNYAVETGLGNLITDLMRQVGNLDREVDVGIQNAGGIRSNTVYGPGEITGIDVMDILPFPNEIAVYEVSGEQLHTYLENSVRPMPGDFGSQPAIQVSGISYEWTGHDGEREVENTFVGGEPLDESESYLVATNDFVAGRSVLGEGDLVLQSGQFQGPFVVDQLEARETVAPEREHRMIRVDEEVGDAAVSADGDTLSVTAPIPDAAEGTAPAETYRVVSRDGSVVDPESVEAADGEVTATFAAGDLADLASGENPTLRLIGGFDPDEQHYGYENDEGDLRELPPSSGYEFHQLKSSIDAAAVRSAVQEQTETETAVETTTTETETTEGTTAEDETGGTTPGFGAAAGAAGVAGGAYLSRRLTADDAENDEA